MRRSLPLFDPVPHLLLASSFTLKLLPALFERVVNVAALFLEHGARVWGVLGHVLRHTTNNFVVSLVVTLTTI